MFLRKSAGGCSTLSLLEVGPLVSSLLRSSVTSFVRSGAAACFAECRLVWFTWSAYAGSPPVLPATEG